MIPTPNRSKWSDAEELILRRHWKVSTDREISRMLAVKGFHRSPDAVGDRRKVLGLIRAGGVARACPDARQALDDGHFVANVLAAGGFPRAERLNGQTVWVYPGRAA